MTAAALVNDDITSPPQGISNVSEWCKREACWFLIKNRADELESRLKPEFFDGLVSREMQHSMPPSKQYVIKYSHGPSENPSGTLAPGEEVRIKDDMRFRVSGTGES